MTLTEYETQVDVTMTENDMFCALVNKYIEDYHEDDDFDVENYEIKLENMSHDEFVSEYADAFLY